MNQRYLINWAVWQTKYAATVPKNLGLGLNFWPCSEGYFLSGRPQSVHSGTSFQNSYYAYDTLRNNLMTINISSANSVQLERSKRFIMKKKRHYVLHLFSKLAKTLPAENFFYREYFSIKRGTSISRGREFVTYFLTNYLINNFLTFKK